MEVLDIIKNYLFSSPLNKEKIIKLALACKGWTTHKKLSLLYDLAQDTRDVPGDVLEIGSAWGRSTVLLGLCSKKTVWSIDPHTGGISFIRQGEQQESYCEFKQNLRRHGINKKVKILKYTTDEVVKGNLIPENIRFSLVFIDGLHTADGVKKDFDLAFYRTNARGVIVFDDYFEPSVADYASMINEICAYHLIEMTKDQSSKLVYLRK